MQCRRACEIGATNMVSVMKRYGTRDNRYMKEYNKESKNYDPARGRLKNDPSLKNDFAGNKTASEFHADPDNYANKSKFGRAILALFAATLVATLLFGGTALSTGEQDPVKIDIVSTWVSASEVGYHIVVPQNEDGLILAVYNNNTRLETRLYGGDNEGVLSGLNADRTYNFEVTRQDSASPLAQKKIRTKSK